MFIFVGMESLSELFTEHIGLSHKHMTEFCARLKTKELRKKDHLIREGEVCDFIGFVSKGTLRSYIQSDEMEMNNDFYFEHDFVSAYTSFLTNKPTNCNIQALSDCTILLISNKEIEELIASDPLFLKLSKYISDTNFIRKCRRETSFLKHSAAERFQGLSKTYPGIEQKVSQYHIASYLGIKPESLSRIKLLTYINKK